MLQGLLDKDRRHRQICSECHTAGQHTEKLCDAGWDRAKKIARAQAAVRRAEAAQPAQLAQGTLW